MIHFRCPRCGQTFVAPEPAAGARTDCPECGQRVAVPAVPPTVVHRAKTTDQSRGAKTASPAKTTAHPPSSQTRMGELTGEHGEVPEVQPADNQEWDVDLVAVEPDSQGRRRRKRRRRSGEGAFCCPFCHNESDNPLLVKKMSDTGFVVCVVLALAFFPLCWIGLFFTNTWRVCPHCGKKSMAVRGG